jgi:beta-glucosidase
MKHASIGLVWASLLLLEMAPAGGQQPRSAASQPPYQQAGLPVETRVRDLLSRMTVEEKARQLDMYAGPTAERRNVGRAVREMKAAGFQPEAARKLWGDLGVGSMHDLHPTAELANTIQQWIMQNSRLGIPAIYIEEGLHEFSEGTTFPSPLNLSATFNLSLARRTGAAIAAEARAAGADMLLAPVLDLAREPRWGRIEEDLGEDPFLTGQMGLAWVQGAQGDSLATDHTVAAEPKHFAGHGSPESGTNTSPVHIGERELRSIMLKSFEPAFREGKAMGAMAAYHEIDGIPVAASPLLFSQILRHEWGFQGFVISDLGAIQRLYGDHHVAATPKDAICMALNAGVDMQFYDFDHDVFQKSIVSGIQDGSLSPAALDRAVSGVLRVKFLLGLFDHPMVDPSLAAKVNRSQAHLDLSIESARQSMTLLKNDNHLLPLSKSLTRITVIGPNADVARYGDYANASKGARISMLTGIRQLLPRAAITFDDGKDIPAAVAKVSNAEVVILGLGERPGISGENADRASLSLPDNQEALLEAVCGAGKPVVLVLQNGRPLTIGWAKDHVPAILEAWYPAEFGGTAIAETLFGDNVPAGRLTVTFPRSLGQLPVYYNYHPSKIHRYVDDDPKPLFPFGFGLSYTTFEYRNLLPEAPKPGSKDDLIVTVDVTNTGSVAGDEVAQLYVREDVSSVETPVRALKGFARIHLKPGETAKVRFEVPQEHLALWNAQQRWVVEPGNYTVWAGGSSAATLSAKFTLRR